MIWHTVFGTWLSFNDWEQTKEVHADILFFTQLLVLLEQQPHNHVLFSSHDG